MSRNDQPDSDHSRRQAQDELAADEAWVSRVRDVYEPETMTSAQRAAFDARLEARIERASRGRWTIAIARPALVAAVAAALWLNISPEDAPPEPERVAVMSAPAPASRPESLRAWQREMMAVADPASTDSIAPQTEDLPADYQALDSLLLAGGHGGSHGR